MANLEREFMINASKLEISNCHNVDKLQEVCKGLLDVIQKQKDFIDVSFKKFYLGIDANNGKD